VHQQGYKVALTGEGSDEWLAGYAWFKVQRLIESLDWLPGVKPSYWLRRFMLWGIGAPRGSAQVLDRVYKDVRSYTSYQDMYNLMGTSRLRFYTPQTLEQLGDYSPYRELEPNFERIERWHPLNRAFFWAARVHLTGHLLSLKGDRVAMNSSVETRYPFLDEETFAFLARIHPRWKLRGFKDKYLLRLLCERYLPKEVAWRPKGMFRAPLDSFFDHQVPRFVEQLLSDESLKKTGYFDIEAVRFWSDKVRNRKLPRTQRASVELGLVAVVATQLWYHTFIDGSLAEIPSQASRPSLASV
jgi:asparagine synthase (glutamine-hydrolysing)